MSILMRFDCGCIGIPLGDYSKGRIGVEALIFKGCELDYEKVTNLDLYKRWVRLDGKIRLDGKQRHIPPRYITNAEEREILSGISRLIADGEEMRRLADTLRFILER